MSGGVNKISRRIEMKLNVTAFALAVGIWWGVGLFLATWWLIAFGESTNAVPLLEQFYFGYAITPTGSLIGLSSGFICGAVCGAILAWLYNFLVDRIGVGSEAGMVKTH